MWEESLKVNGKGSDEEVKKDQVCKSKCLGAFQEKKAERSCWFLTPSELMTQERVHNDI